MTIALQNYQISVLRQLIWVLFALLMTGKAQADGAKLTGAEITSTLSEKETVGTDNGKASSQIFRVGGATFYSVGDNQTTGNWKVEGDKYCSVWPPSENWVCYDVFREGSSVTFVSPSGKASSYRLK